MRGKNCEKVTVSHGMKKKAVESGKCRLEADVCRTVTRGEDATCGGRKERMNSQTSGRKELKNLNVAVR